MIKVNDAVISQEMFGDGTLKCPVASNAYFRDANTILWAYDNDTELFTLYCIVRDLQEKNLSVKNTLIMPYIPHARQDRNVSGRLFTLKYFAEIINSLQFARVFVLDPHSDASLALIDRIADIRKYEGDRLSNYINGTVMFPDAGAAKKYSKDYTNPVIVGNKHRNSEGRIESYELLNFVDGTDTVTIRDDICSYGGTFVAAAKELRSRGVEHINLVVSHCENNIVKGDVFNYIDRVYTTDSICTVVHPKLEIVRRYRSPND